MVLRAVRSGRPAVRHDVAGQIGHTAPRQSEPRENGQKHFGNRKCAPILNRVALIRLVITVIESFATDTTDLKKNICLVDCWILR